MAKSARSASALQLGRREANKREKLVRIRRAAKEVFLRKGFEEATIREIATVADVAFGTLFLYARDKQDLLLLLFDEELPGVADRAYRKVKPDAAFVEQLITFFREFYTFFNLTPQLSRDMLREVTFGGGIVATRLRAGLQGIEGYVARLVAQAQANGSVSSSITPDLAAHIIFSLHRIEIRICLSDAVPNIESSVDKLRRQFEVVLTGMAPRTASVLAEATGPGHSARRNAR